MDAQEIFQLAASTAASACSGASLAFWLLSIGAPHQPAFHSKPVLLSQAVIGGALIIGSITSIVLTIQQTNPKSNISWSVQGIGSGCLLLLLILDEYLSVSTLQSKITHVVAGAFFVSTMIILPLSIYLPEHHNLLLILFMVTALVGLSFVYIQYFRFWVKCMKLESIQTSAFEVFWRHPGRTAHKLQRALWAASVLSIGLFVLLLCLAILASTKPCLWTQIIMLQIAIISLRKAVLSAYLLGAPDGRINASAPHECA
ncbi:uncharacterized protein BDV17DRAFT_25722 [Aspergillus undulatus]|uniref:uncharacterized protein n=1 Tax=Aspergillus undulatus TaxID=1810928 RepID=UPI003CCD2401